MPNAKTFGMAEFAGVNQESFFAHQIIEPADVEVGMQIIIE
jgi:hypothetical protein